jgi:uncharacterized protein YciI
MVFLLTGPETAPQAEVAKRQAAHIENFRRLDREKRLYLVGPTMQPNSNLRGILLLSATDKAQVEKEFLADPYITEKNMVIKVHKFNPLRGEFASKTGAKMNAWRMVLMTKEGAEKPAAGSDWSRILTKQIDFYAKNDCPFILAGALDDDAAGGFFGIVASGEDDMAWSAASRAPMIQSGAMKARISPIFLAQGGVPPLP